ncbi:MAG: glycosyltransferase [FCB group bacterium]|nr:glycosyltransferase [FCB group bacterium]
MTPRLSIITPVYCNERFIEACINNVIDQDCPNAEHIIIDGDSTDGTVEIIKKYAARCSHIHWISQKDEGQSEAMNKGIKMARGEIIGFLNADDFYEPNVLNHVLTIFETLPEPSLLVGSCNMWDDNNNLVFVNRPTKLKLTDILAGNEFPINPSAYFYHASLHQEIGPYREDLHFEMDLDFILKAVQRATIKYVDEVWGNFRQIQGTKTLSLVNSGRIEEVQKPLMDYFKKRLSLFQQFELLVKIAWLKIKTK